MKVVYSVLGTAMAVVMSGCGPKLAPPLSQPVAPQTSIDVIKVPLQWESDYDLNDNIAYLKAHKVVVGSSVVLNVPPRILQEQSEQDVTTQGFKTEGFFNVAEQQIERGLLNSGFRVLSRAKFEAKLRSLRDLQKDYSTSMSGIRSESEPEVRILIDEIQSQYEKGTINEDKYIDKIKYFKNKLQVTAAGKRRNSEDQELTDISEVIRAASSDGVKADYILQINEFDTNKKLVVKNRLGEVESVRAFVRKYPDVKREFDNGNDVFRCAVIGAVLNAKLIHVATGEIVWIGENKLNEVDSGVNNITVELGARTSVSNEREVRNFVNQNNGMLARELRFGKDMQVPAWDFTTSLIPATLVAGDCKQEWTPNNDKSLKLARKVSKDLIATIKTFDPKIKE